MTLRRFTSLVTPKDLPNEYSYVIASVDDEKNVEAVKNELGKDYESYSIQDTQKVMFNFCECGSNGADWVWRLGAVWRVCLGLLTQCTFRFWSELVRLG